MKKRIMTGTVAMVFFMSLMTGCGTIDSTVATEKDSEAANITQSSTVKLVVSGSEEDQELMKMIFDSFIEKYSSETEFDITYTIVSEATCKDVMLGDLLHSADVFAFVDDQVMPMVAAGALDPVENAEEIMGRNNAGAVEAAVVNGTLYAYPLTADNGYFMYYNKEYFSDEDVKTLDAMLEVAAKNDKKVVMDWSSGWYIYSFFGNTGLTLGLNDDGISNYCTWNATDGAIKGTDVAKAMLEISSNSGFENANSTGFLEGVDEGSVIAGISGVWDANYLEQKWGDNLGAVKLPTYTCADKQIQMASFTGYKLVGVNAYSKNTEWAQKLADWITNEENQQLRFEMRKQGPANNNAAKSELVQKSPAIQAVIEQSAYGQLQRVSGKYWDPVQVFGEKMAEGNTAGKSLQDILDTMVEGITMSNAQ